MKNKKYSLGKLHKKLEELKNSPLYQYRRKNNYQMVFGEGPLTAPIMFVGEAPGKKEAETGRPFVGKAGKILDELLIQAHLARSKVYITNIVKDRPPKNKTPGKQEINIYAPFLIKQIQIIQPKILVPLGRVPMKFLMSHFNLRDKLAPISQIHGQVFHTQASFGKLIIMPLYHPAYAIYRRDKKEILAKDMKKLSQISI
jgi:DNA polymerase